MHGSHTVLTHPAVEVQGWVPRLHGLRQRHRGLELAPDFDLELALDFEGICLFAIRTEGFSLSPVTPDADLGKQSPVNKQSLHGSQIIHELVSILLTLAMMMVTPSMRPCFFWAPVLASTAPTVFRGCLSFCVFLMPLANFLSPFRPLETIAVPLLLAAFTRRSIFSVAVSS